MPTLRSPLPDRASEAGYSLVELLAVGAIVAIALTATAGGLRSAYDSHQLRSGISELQAQIHRAHVAALKEKTTYRLVFHDQQATSANTVVLERNEGGTFNPVSDGTRELPGSVALLGTSPNDSMNSMTVTPRGACGSGTLYLHGDNGVVVSVAVAPTCSTTVTQVSS